MMGAMLRVRAIAAGAALCLTLVGAAGLTGCGASAPKLPPAGSAEPDKFLFDRGTEQLKAKNWVAAREYFRNLVDRYPQSPFRPDAKLALGDTYILENSVESKILAVNEFSEFLSYFPTHPRADYAQFRIAYAYYKQMLSPQRDQTETRQAIAAFDVFFQNYPNSALRPEVEKYARESRDRLSESEFEVGRFYARINWCAGAVDRLQGVLKADPKYTNRDGAYFYLGECYNKIKQPAAALPFYDRIVQEFEKSEYLEKAKKRIEEIKRSIVTSPK
jgi:outer membrane protein assembly factor BamD